MSKIITIGIGADPEFVMTKKSTGSFVSASNLLRSGGAFGRDGCGSIGELRPHYASSALALIGNIKATMTDGVIYKIQELKNYNFLAGHYKNGYSIGGHIHISGFRISADEFGRLLDKVMYPLSDILDDLRERASRRNTGYGKGWRMERGERWLEYRMPGSWLLSPHVAFLNLWIAEASAYAYLDGVRDHTADFWQSLGTFSMSRIPSKMEFLLKFAEKMSGKAQHGQTFMKVADSVFKNLPLNWNIDFKESWEVK